MRNEKRKNKCINLKLCCFVIVTSFAIFATSCSKQEALKQNISAADSSALQINYVAKIKNSLKDSLTANDFSSVDFSKVFKSKDVRSKNYFLRLTLKGKKISNDFILLKTDNIGNILKAKIVHVRQNENVKTSAGITIVASSLNRKQISYLKNKASKSQTTNVNNNSNVVSGSNVSSLKAEEEPVGEQTLPDVVVTGYIYDDPSIYYWYCFDDILGMSSGGGGTYTYGGSETSGGGGYGGIYNDNTIDIEYEATDNPAIDIAKFIKCFSTLSSTGAQFKVTIYSDIPVNSDPNELFDWSTGSPGHSFLQLTKTSGATTIQQYIGFYPETGWKSLANNPVTSKVVDNGGHEYNASLTITVDATHFQNALNKMQSESTVKYDIDDFNCTDFALTVFNSAASTPLSIPRMHIPNGTFGNTSNTPQGLYKELTSLQSSGGYPGGQISIPNNAPKAGSSHGACN